MVPWAISNLSVKFVFSNIFDINPGTTIYFEDVIIIIQKPLSKRQGPLRASVVETHVKRYLKWNLKPWQPCDSSVMLQLVFLLITFTLLPTKKPSPGGPAFAEPLYQWLEHISRLNLVVFAFSERKTDPNSFKLVNSSHMSETQSPYGAVPPYIYRGCFSKHYSKSYVCPRVNMWHPVLLIAYCF